MNDRARFMGEENIKKVLLKLAVPGIVGMLVIAIYNIVDTYFIGMLGDTRAIGAVSVAFPLTMLIGAAGQMFGVGANSYISRLLGGKKQKEAETASATAFFTTILVALAFTGLALPRLDRILAMFGATNSIMPFAMDYGKIMVLYSLFIMINMTMNNMIRAEGGATYSMAALSLGAGLNIILDPLFIFTFDMGIKGAAWATISGQIVSTVFLLAYYFSGKGQVPIKLSRFKPTMAVYAEIFKIGVPTLIRQVLVSVSMGLINTAAMIYGDAAVAAMGVSLRVLALAFYVTFGYIQGFLPVVGYNYGAGEIDRVKKSISFSIRVTTVFNTLACGVFLIFAEPIIASFSNDVEVISIGTKALRYSAALLPFFGYIVIGNGVFQALGKGREAMLLSVARQGLFLIPAVFVLPRILGLQGIFLAQPFADVMTILTTYILVSKLKKEIEEDRTESLEPAHAA